VGGYVLVYARAHTQTTWVLNVSPGVGRTPRKPEESRWTKAQYTRRQYICVQSTFVYIYAGLWVLMQQITVSHFSENKRLHLESSKQNYYIISLQVMIKAIFIHL